MKLASNARCPKPWLLALIICAASLYSFLSIFPSYQTMAEHHAICDVDDNCDECNGAGTVVVVGEYKGQMWDYDATCLTCNGSGKCPIR
jgi:hypothetical protein